MTTGTGEGVNIQIAGKTIEVIVARAGARADLLLDLDKTE